MHDICVVGGGIVGLATARALLQRRPGLDLVLLEKEGGVARHQTGHNSGVIHAGIYYEPGSLKARLCTQGARSTRDFCDQRGIPYRNTGKLIVATTPAEMPRLDALYERAQVNGLDVERIDAVELGRREPNVVGLGAIFLRSTGIVDYRLVSAHLGQELAELGGQVVTNAEVVGIDEAPSGVSLRTASGQTFQAGRVVVCGGLQADRLARMARMAVDFQIVPFRGEYYRLPSWRNDIVSTLIYPVPDPTLPFLGVHLTRMMDGGVTVGPNAVLALAREGYRKASFSGRDVAAYLSYPGTWRLGRRYLRTGVMEAWGSLDARRYLSLVRRYCPSVTLGDLQPEPAGIRAQALLRDGTLVHDFLLRRTNRTLHVCNAPSPAATSALPIGELISHQVSDLAE